VTPAAGEPAVLVAAFGTIDFPGRRIAPGTIALQGHDARSTIYYKNILIKPLK